LPLDKLAIFVEFEVATEACLVRVVGRVAHTVAEAFAVCFTLARTHVRTPGKVNWK
jgi:hypothetical protein